MTSSRAVLQSAALYAVADVAVLVVGGFLLLPLYTRTLSQAEFGAYVAIKANTDLLTYLLHFGLPSAVARLYFDYQSADARLSYLSSIVSLFAFIALLLLAVLFIWGDALWSSLSPSVSAHPYLWYSFAIAAASFPGALAAIWLRVSARAVALVLMQGTVALLLVLIATFNLVVLRTGLDGLLIALLLSSATGTLVLIALFGGRFRPSLQPQPLQETLRFAAPILMGYLAYFVLNRIATLLLQRHVTLEEVATFGLAQQVAAVLPILAGAIGKALQPAVYAAQPSQAIGLLRGFGHRFILMMFLIASGVVIFASEIFAMLAPRSYAGGASLLTILTLATLAYSFIQISDTALLYYRRPKTSVAVSMLGAGLTLLWGLLLIPRYSLYGAALASVAAYVAMVTISHLMAWRLTRLSHFQPMLLALGGALSLAVVVGWLQQLQLELPWMLIIKGGLCALLLAAAFSFHARLERGRCAS